MRRTITLVAAVIALVVPASALANSSPTCQSYNPQLCSSVNANTTTGSGPPSSTANTSNSAGGPSTSTSASNRSSTLPFTGLDVVLLVVGGGALLSAGFVIRRVSRRLN
jgi:hypothetical protein